jgi:predicted SAM-dependent methyltransferase
MNLIVGAKETSFPGWLSTDLRAPGARLDIRRSEDWQRRFAPNSIDRAVAEHVLEHLTEDEALAALCNVRSYLKPGGRLRIAVPDKNNPNCAYQEHSRPGGKGQAWARLLWYNSDEPEHKVHYDFQTLSALIERAGLTPRLLEYCDAAGNFHRNQWSLQDGPLRRYYNSPYNLNWYLPFHGFQNTSLIIDAVKGRDDNAADARCAVVMTNQRETCGCGSCGSCGVDSTGRLIVLVVLAAVGLYYAWK